MTSGIPDSLERLTQADLIGVVRELIGEVGRLRAENEKLNGALTKDELARLKKLPPRPPQKPSGMDKATDRGGSGGGGAKSAEGEKSSRPMGVSRSTPSPSECSSECAPGRTSLAMVANRWTARMNR